MKKLHFILLAAAVFSVVNKSFAQDEKGSKDKKTETNEIIIRKDGDKETKITVQIDGDNILVNGKPMVEFNADGVTIMKRKMMISEGTPFLFDGDLDEEGNFRSIDEKSDSVAFLGVSTEKSDKGAKVISVSKESPAEKAGLKEDDIITKLNKQKIEDPASLYNAVIANKPNEEVKITYLRDGKEKTITAKLQLKKQVERKVIVMNNGRKNRRPNPPGFPPPFNRDEAERNMPNNDFGEESGNLAYGFKPFPPKQKLGVKIQDIEEGNGVKVIDVADSSVASKAGVVKGDIITEISGQKINNTDDIREMLSDNEIQSSYKVKVLRNGVEMNFEIKPPKKLKTMIL